MYAKLQLKAQIDIPLLYPRVVSKDDLANKRHESTNNGDVLDACAHSAPYTMGPKLFRSRFQIHIFVHFSLIIVL